jgi:hypothetical protein
MVWQRFLITSRDTGVAACCRLEVSTVESLLLFELGSEETDAEPDATWFPDGRIFEIWSESSNLQICQQPSKRRCPEFDVPDGRLRRSICLAES